MHSYPVFFVALLADFGCSRAQTSLAYSVSHVLTGASAPPVRVRLDRERQRRAEPARTAPAASGARARDWTVAEAMATPHFWLLFLVYLLTGLGSFFVSLHQLAFAADMGFDTLQAASILGMGSFLSVAG